MANTSQGHGRSPSGSSRSLTRIYLGSARGVAAAQKTLQGAFAGLWLGLLSPEQLHNIDEAFYHRDSLYVRDEYNRSGLFDWERDFAKDYLSNGNRVAVTGAGGGREVRGLKDLGFDTVGFECNDKLRDAGNRMLETDGFGAGIRSCQRDRWPQGDGLFDALIVGWGSYMLIPGRDRRVAFMSAARRDLVPGAPVLLSFFARNNWSRGLRLTASVGSAIRTLRRRPPIEIGDSLAPNYVHWFSREQIASELSEAGYDLTDFATEPYGRAVAQARPGAD